MELKQDIKNKYIRIRGDVNAGEVFIEGEIGKSLFVDGYTFDKLKIDLSQIEGDITINLRGPGGDLWEAFAMHDYLRSVKNHVVTKIIGMSASSTTVIAQGGDVRMISPNSRYLIHKPMIGMMGNSDDYRKILGTLESLDMQCVNLYAQRSTLSKEQILSLMMEDKFITADEALEYGFVDSIIENKTQTKVTNQTHEKMSEKMLKALNVENEDKGLEVLNDLQAKAKQLDDKFVELQILNEEKEDKDKEIEDLKAEIAKLKDKLKAKEVDESEKEAENIKNLLDKATAEGKLDEKTVTDWQEVGELKGSAALEKMLNAIPAPNAGRDYRNHMSDGQKYATKEDLTNAFKANKLTAGEYAKGLKLFN